MPTNPFFNLYGFNGEQNLLNDLATEMIKMHGIDVYYMPRTHVNLDELFGEDSSSKFDNAIQIEMYLKDYAGFGGDGDLMSKFGLMVGDTLTMCVARRRFDEEVGRQYNFARPREGDLLYFPFTTGIFEIKFVEHESTFYQTGALQHYELRCEKFNYSSETFDTGVDVIDQVSNNYSQKATGGSIDTESNTGITSEASEPFVTENFGSNQPDNPLFGQENEFFQNTASGFIDFSIKDPFSEGGTF